MEHLGYETNETSNPKTVLGSSTINGNPIIDNYINGNVTSKTKGTYVETHVHEWS
jgi:hypothetical protein